MYVDDSGWLQRVEAEKVLPPLLKVPSVRTTPLLLDLAGPLGMVWHWTAGPARGPAFAAALAEEIRTFNRMIDRPASWHVLVAKDGRLFQSVPFVKGSWHVGRQGRIGEAPKLTEKGLWDATNGWKGQLFNNINAGTVGVELENSGRLLPVGNQYYCSPYWVQPGKPASGLDPRLEIPADRVIAHGTQWFDGFPQAQEDAAVRLLKALVLAYRWTRDVCQYGHLMFDPLRKEDPGPVWLEVVLPRILDTVFGPLPAPRYRGMARTPLFILVVLLAVLAPRWASASMAGIDAGTVDVPLVSDALGPVAPSPDTDLVGFFKAAHELVNSKEWGKLLFFAVTLLVWVSRKFFDDRIPWLASPMAAIGKTFLLAFTGVLATTWPAGGRPHLPDVFTALQVGFAAAGGWSVLKALLEAAAGKWSWAKKVLEVLIPNVPPPKLPPGTEGSAPLTGGPIPPAATPGAPL